MHIQTNGVPITIHHANLYLTGTAILSTTLHLPFRSPDFRHASGSSLSDLRCKKNKCFDLCDDTLRFHEERDTIG